MMTNVQTIAAATALLGLGACANEPPADPASGNHGDAAPLGSGGDGGAEARAEGDWIPLFDGESLDGWTPKFSGSELGENVLDTFRVADGLLQVRYDGYEDFGGRFGHLFFDGTFESYDIRAVYRFVGEQCPGGPGWARRNNGLMLHGQAPETMGRDQDFPVSVEAQMLGVAEEGQSRATGGVCTPGTNVEIGGELKRDHCIGSSGPTIAGDAWVEMIVEVRPDRVRHLVDGEVVHEYGPVHLDERDGDAKRLMGDSGETLLTSGTISIQAESHPIDFKAIELRRVE